MKVYNRMVRFGIGQDSHRFENEKPLTLGGIHIADSLGLQGNSDGDVVLHALCNALGTAVGRGSLSTYSDSMCKQGIRDSKEYVRVALGFVSDAGYHLSNVSFAIEARKPKLEKHFPDMKQSIAELLGIHRDAVGIAVTSGEKLTAFGMGEGIQVFASVCLEK